jgi:regulatory protein
LRSRSTETQTAERAYKYALRLLAGRDYSVAKMRGKLSARDVSEHDIDATLLKLQVEGWMDDRRYAERFAESALSAGRFYGPRLRMEMRRRGFEAVLVNDILERLQSDSDGLTEVRSVMARRYPDFKFFAATDRDKRRVIGFLQRCGFRISSIMLALRAEEQTY